VNIFAVLAMIRMSDREGEYIKIADAIMNLYLERQITCPTVLMMYGEITRIMITNTSPYGSTIQDRQVSQGV
jgi:hypothetical protein